MTLPKLNNELKFKVKVPSLKKEYTARPYLAKEEKNLLFALETEDNEQIVNAVIETLNTCVPDLNTEIITPFDLEYVFLQLRSFSVGETAEVSLSCENCETDNATVINLQDATIEDIESNTIELSESISLELKYPSIKTLKKEGLLDSVEKVNSHILFKYLRLVINKVVTADEQLIFSDYSKVEQEEFIDQLSQSQLMEIMNFIENTPQVEINHNFTCTECNHNQTFKVKGLSNFFS